MAFPVCAYRLSIGTSRVSISTYRLSAGEGTILGHGMPQDPDPLAGTRGLPKSSISSRAQIAFVYEMGYREQPAK